MAPSLLTMFENYSTLDLTLGSLVSVLVIYLIHLMISSNPSRKKVHEKFISKKDLDDKAKVMLNMLETEIDTKYDYSSTIRVAKDKMVTTAQTAKACYVITDPDEQDNPIIYASEQFSECTGYKKNEIEGRNCRFLQGPDTDPEDVKEIRIAIEQKKEVSLKLLNYKKDGTTFTNQFFLCPLYAPDKTTVCYYIGVQKELDLDNMPHEHGFDGENAGYRCFLWL